MSKILNLTPMGRALNGVRTLSRTPIADGKAASDAAKHHQSSLNAMNEIRDAITDQAGTSGPTDLRQIRQLILNQATNSKLPDPSNDQSEFWPIDTNQNSNESQNSYLSELVSTSKEISSKISALAAKLENRSAENVPVEVENQESTSEDLLGRSGIPEPELETPTTDLARPEPRQSDELQDNTNGSDNVKGAPDKDKETKSLSKMDAVKKTIESGFKNSLALSDKISGMLFKYTTTQLLNAAKTAAVILALVVGLDVLKILWERWGGIIQQKLAEAIELFKTWWEEFKNWTSYFSDFSKAFDNMSGDWMAIRNAWESGNWPSLIKALGVAIKDLCDTLASIIVRAITKLGATMLNALGFKGAATTVEAAGLQYQQNKSKAAMSPENQRKLAEAQLKKQKTDGKVETERGLTSFLPNSWRNNLGILSDNEMKQIDAEKKAQASRNGLSHDQQIENIAASNEARKAVDRFIAVADNAKADNSNDMKKYSDLKNQAQAAINNPNLALTPSIKNELQQQLESHDKLKTAATVKPASSNDSQESQLVQSIKSQPTASQQAQNNTTANITNTSIKNSKTVQVQSPITGTRPPGIFNATKVN